MKAILFILAICGFYYGMNQYALSASALERWIEKTHFPSPETSDVFCQAIIPKTEAHFTYSINGKSAELGTDKGDTLCQYWHSREIPGAELRNTNLNFDNIEITRLQEFPFNKAIANIKLHYNIGVPIKIKDPETGSWKSTDFLYQIIRKEEIKFQRTIFGDYQILSIKGHDDLVQPRKARH